MITLILAVADPAAWTAALSRQPDLTVMATAGSLREAVGLAVELKPHWLVVEGAWLADASWHPALTALQAARCVVAPTIDAAVAQAALAIHARAVAETADVRRDPAAWLTVSAADSTTHRLVAVFAPKGGVGKTTLATTLACGLSAVSHQPIGLTDLDLACGDVATMLGVTPIASWADTTAALDAAWLQRVLTSVPHSTVHLLAAPPSPVAAEDISADMIGRGLRVLRDYATYGVVDTAPGFGDATLTALDAADVVLVVVTPDLVAMRSTALALQVLAQDLHYGPEKVRVVLNRADSGTGLTDAAIADVLAQPVWARLPSNGAIPVQAANTGVPLWRFRPTAPLTQGIATIAERLWAETQPVSRRRQHRWWGRKKG
jgi:pilus assembly protein CpaE